ncbi:MAG: CRISPR-associated helicase Cas3', partial [Muribaculaceae bacterium]|nr:CRISPR-associated helicase Cas3' [Muribaculaceae bacterium]
MKDSSKIISHIYHDDDKKNSVIDKANHTYSDSGWHIQSNQEHCEGVANLASTFAAEFGMSDWGRMMGLLHDRGKESQGFQAYIRCSSGFDPKAYSNLPHFHSYVGGILAHQIPYDQLYWLSNAIAGHHKGLSNLDELELDLKKTIPDEVSQNIPNIPLSLPKFKIAQSDSSHISRMLFSCLVDADWLDTENFMQPEKTAIRGQFDLLEELRLRLQDYRKKLSSLPSSPLNLLRNEIQRRCEEMALYQPGFFELTVPTGGGKTIASIIWAINHAIRFNKKRIIIAIPFTSIIAQTAATLRKIFGDKNVIEHHSAVNESVNNERSLLACENWDAPIIVTTNVQFFESMFSNRPAACRKLHSIVNSVVILDEVQTLPLTFLQPIVSAMTTYTKIFGTSFLFCTASQPILDGYRQGCNAAVFKGIDRSQIRTIINSDLNLHSQLRRANITISEHKYTYSLLAQELINHKRVLCIVNSRRHALELYRELISSADESVPTFHLSRSMCSAHILETIEEIKKILSDSAKGIRIISTQLIEAGVDIDFPVVYRQLSGLDSILQAAGRCNREGKLQQGTTIVFSFQEERETGALRVAADTMKDMLSLYPDSDWLSPEIMRLYFEKLY